MFLGLDCSTKAVHGILLDDEENIIEQFKWGSTEKDFVDRFPQILEKFQADLSTINITDLATVEAAIYIQNPRTTLSIAYVVGAIWSSLSLANICSELVDNRRWKKDILNKGNAKKPEIKEFASAKWGDVFKEQDFADAACIALWGKRRSLDVIEEA
tara:strand:- start:370 stop:840 length:471 start_codon:yes stop_codon:yes gene_type:complete